MLSNCIKSRKFESRLFNMSTVIISADELRRMRNSTKPPDNNASKTAMRRAELKKLSTEKMKSWPNTLEAIRLKKESFLKNREEADERARQEVDKAEAELARDQRLEAIRRANNLIYEQTDQMKMLKSQKAYSEAIYTRQFQIKDKQAAAEQEKIREAEYHAITMEKVRLGEEQERLKKEKQAEEVKKIKVIRQQQRDDAKARAREIQEKERQEGIRLKEDFKAQLQEDLVKQEQRQKMIIEKNYQNLEENKKGKILRDEARAAEQRAIDARDAEVAVIDKRKADMKRLEKRRFDRVQETKQKMIDAAVRQLAAQQNQSNAVLAKQEQDVRDREDKKEADKEAKRKAEWDAIVASRTEIINRKEAELLRKDEEEAEMVAKFKSANEAGIQEEKDKVLRAKEAQTAIKMIQLADGKARRKQIEDEIAAQKEQERFLQSISANDDKRFKEICIAEIEKNVAQGKPVYTLLRALEFVAPPLMGAKIVKRLPEEHKARREASK